MEPSARVSWQKLPPFIIGNERRTATLKTTLPLDWRIPLEPGQSLSVIAVFPLVIAPAIARDHPSNRARSPNKTLRR